MDLDGEEVRRRPHHAIVTPSGSSATPAPHRSRGPRTHRRSSPSFATTLAVLAVLLEGAQSSFSTPGAGRRPRRALRRAAAPMRAEALACRAGRRLLGRGARGPFRTAPAGGPPRAAFSPPRPAAPRPGLWAHEDRRQSAPRRLQQLSTSSPPQFDGATDVASSEPPRPPDGVTCWFARELPEGWCVGVRAAASPPSAPADAPLDATTALHPDEYRWGRTHLASDAARASYYLGRMALRAALDGAAARAGDGAAPASATAAIGRDRHGRPVLPGDVLGSISHKGECAVGVARWRAGDRPEGGEAADSGHGAVRRREECPLGEEGDGTTAGSGEGAGPAFSVLGVGIDLERIDARRGRRIERKVLTPQERRELGTLEAMGISSAEEVLLRFSLKESVYKALHPILCQYVGFQEAEVAPRPDGTARVTLTLTGGQGAPAGLRIHTASWRRVDGFFLTSAAAGVGPDAGTADG